MADLRSNDRPFLGSHSMEALSCGPGPTGTGNTQALPWNSSATRSTNVYRAPAVCSPVPGPGSQR